MQNEIYIKGARANNLRNIDLKIPRDKMVVLTGLSGSGKSSLAFDTIYAEGQRRYVESLSSYARQFLGQMEKPDVEFIEGLSPAISIDQKTTSKNPRSTVGTVTEIHDYLRLLYARVGVPHCHICGREISSQSVDQIVDALMEYEEGTKLILLAPVVRGRKGQHEKLIDRIRREGFTRVRVDGELYQINEEEIKLEKNNKHNIEIVIDRIVIKDGQQGRISEAVELAIKEGEGLVLAQLGTGEDSKERMFSTKLACPDHGIGIEELEPRTFSFNNPFGACPVCNGIGFTEKVDENAIIKEEESIEEGALSRIFATMQFTKYYWDVIRILAEMHKVDLSTPFKDLPKKFKDELLYGTGDRKLKYELTSNRGKVQQREHTFEGLIVNLERRYRESNSDLMKEWMGKFMTVHKCEACQGKRLRLRFWQ